MRRVWLALAVAVLLVMAIPAVAADLQESHKGTMCPGGFVSLHFVNNQTGGAAAGTLTAEFSDGSLVVKAADKVNRNVQHFDVLAPSGTTLVDASTDLPGKLVLSDHECRDGKKS